MSASDVAVVSKSAAGDTTAKPASTCHALQFLSPRIVAADLAAAIIVGGVAAVPISIVDFAIMAKVAGIVPTMNAQVVAGVKILFTNPKNFFFVDTPTTKYSRVYRLCVVVYAGTYCVANVGRSVFEGYVHQTPETVAINVGVVSSIANIALTIWKDSNILRVMPAAAVSAGAAGAAAAATKKVFIPMLSRVGFALRDAITCLSAFTVVPLFKTYLETTYPGVFTTPYKAQTFASLVTPASLQIITTNIHVPAIKYQRMYDPSSMSWGGPQGYIAGMMNALKIDYVSALRLRVLRIFFAFGLGTIFNYSLRPSFIKFLEPKAM